MKRRTLFVGIGAVAAGCCAMAAMADITGSAHDFTGAGWSDNEICKPCHTPHLAVGLPGGNAAPLWSHELTTATYTLFDGTAGDTTDLDDRSVLCMSCHDGTVAVDSFGGNTGVVFIAGPGLIGIDLSDDHPIGSQAIYPLGVSWMTDPSTWENMPNGFALRNMMVNGTLERVVSCTTCHEPHNRIGTDYMLWVDNNASALCLTCHIK